MGLKMHHSLAVHPGDWMKTEVIEPKGVGVSALAAACGVSRQAISALLNGRTRMTAEMALRLEKLFGISAETLLRMQVRFDLAQLHDCQPEVDRSRLAA